MSTASDLQNVFATHEFSHVRGAQASATKFVSCLERSNEAENHKLPLKTCIKLANPRADRQR